MEAAAILSPRPNFDANQADWEVEVDFPEVEPRLMAQDWSVCRSRLWRWTEKAHIGEARSSAEATRVMLDDGAVGHRAVRIGDNLGASYQLLSVVRRCCALELGWNMSVMDRWVPSELNPADEASRVWNDSAGRQCTISYVGSAEVVSDISAMLRDVRLLHDQAGDPQPRGSDLLRQDGLQHAPHRYLTLAQRHGGAESTARPAPRRMLSEAKREIQSAATAHRGAKRERPPSPKQRPRMPSPTRDLLGAASSLVRKTDPLAPPSDDSSDLDDTPAPLPKRDKRMQQRLKKHWRRGADGASGAPSVLEDSAVQPGTRRRYSEMVDLFLAFCQEKRLTTATPEATDAAMVQFLSRFFNGRTSSDGVYAVVGWMALHPSYGTAGTAPFPWCGATGP